MNKKNIILGGFGALIIGLIAYNSYQISSIEDYIDSNNAEELKFKVQDMKREILKIKKLTRMLKDKAIDNSERIKNLEQLINLKIRVDRSNLIFSNSLENALKKLINLKIELENNNHKNKITNQNNSIKVLPANLTLDNNTTKIKKEKKKEKKIIKVHIQPPTILLAKKLDSIDGQYYLYLTDGTVLTKNSIFQDVFKIKCINPNANIVIMKNINKYSYEYGKVYQIPFKIVFPVNESPVIQNTTSNAPVNLQQGFTQ